MNIELEYDQIFERLTREILPFWLEHGMDRDKDGIFACFDGITGERLADHKFLWVQGRMLWLFSRLYHYLLTEHPASRQDREYPFLVTQVKTAARSVYRFIARHGLEENGNVPFLVTRCGKPTTLPPSGPDESSAASVSTFSDCFVIMGLAAYGRIFEDEVATTLARTLLKSTMVKLREGRFHTYPYPEPTGLESLGSRMILAMAAGELRPAGEAEEFIAHTFQDLRRRFLRPDGFFRELVPRDRDPAATVLLEYVNPGHTLETYGLLQDHADLGVHAGWDATILEQGVLKTLQAGWDEKPAGLFTFLLPGISIDTGVEMDDRFRPDDPYSSESIFKTVQRDWSLKLWWPHVEGMFTALAVGRATNSSELMTWYEMLRDYTLRTFPHPSGREWIHIRDRAGFSVRRVVALPVKDPYHIARSFLKILLLLRPDVGE